MTNIIRDNLYHCLIEIVFLLWIVGRLFVLACEDLRADISKNKIFKKEIQITGLHFQILTIFQKRIQVVPPCHTFPRGRGSVQAGGCPRGEHSSSLSWSWSSWWGCMIIMTTKTLMILTSSEKLFSTSRTWDTLSIGRHLRNVFSLLKKCDASFKLDWKFAHNVVVSSTSRMIRLSFLENRFRMFNHDRAKVSNSNSVKLFQIN